MSESQPTSTKENNPQLQALFQRLLPLVDSLADKLGFALIMGLLLLVWVGVWFGMIKKFSLLVTTLVVGLALLPLLILWRFWWSLNELKNLPAIVDDMTNDAKSQLKESVQQLRSNGKAQWNLVTAGKNLWSLSTMLTEGKELLGSYIGITTLLNPFMLLLGLLSLGFVLFLLISSIVLAFLAF